MTYLYTVPESTTEGVTDVTYIGSTEIGTTDSVTTDIYTTKGMIHSAELGLFTKWSQPRLIPRGGSCIYGVIQFRCECVSRFTGINVKLVSFQTHTKAKLVSVSDSFIRITNNSFINLYLTRGVVVFSPLPLRVRAVFHKTARVCHVYCNFKLGFTCRITVIFGTLKDGSLLINTLASNICFSYRNIFQNGASALSKIVYAFLSKNSKFYLVRIIRLCSNFASLWRKHLLRNYN